MRAPPSYGVLCAPGAGLAVGATVALALRREARTPTAVVLHWTGGARELSPRAPACRRGRRLAAALRAGRHVAWASGRLVFVALPDDAAEAAAAAKRVPRIVGRAPTVLVIAGPRPAAIESMLALQDGLLVVAGEDDLVDLAVSSLDESGLPASVVQAAGSSLARAAAVMGLGLAPRARREMAFALGDPW
jgi:hypothetical protein